MVRKMMILIWTALGIAGAFWEVSAQSALDIREAIRLPAGDWGLGVVPLQLQSQASAPVLILGITNNATIGLAVTKLRVSNQSKYRVFSLRLGWRLYISTDSEKPIMSGVSRSVLLSEPLAAGETADVHATVMNFAPMLQKLLPDGSTELLGVYTAELTAAEVCFEGGAVWVHRVWAHNLNSQSPIIGAVIPIPALHRNR